MNSRNRAAPQNDSPALPHCLRPRQSDAFTSASCVNAFSCGGGRCGFGSGRKAIRT